MCKRLWERYSDFLIIGEAWGCMDVCEEREISIKIHYYLINFFF